MVKTLQVKKRVDYFDSHMVMYLTGDCNYSRVHLMGGKIVLSARTLKWFAQQWPEFLRPHKRALVNPAYVNRLQLASTLQSPSYIIMRDDTPLRISRRRVSGMISQIGQA